MNAEIRGFPSTVRSVQFAQGGLAGRDPGAISSSVGLAAVVSDAATNLNRDTPVRCVPCFEINRPVHLAFRDAAAERAVELLTQPMHGLTTESRIRHIGRVIELLQMSQLHARLAARSRRATERELDFVHFLQVTLQHVQSVYALILNQGHMESREHGFLTKFLGTAVEEISLAALNYRRRAEDMLEGLWHVLRLTAAPYAELQQKNFTDLSPEEQERYRRARAAFREKCKNHMARSQPESGEGTARNSDPPIWSNAAEFAI